MTKLQPLDVENGDVDGERHERSLATIGGSEKSRDDFPKANGTALNHGRVDGGSDKEENGDIQELSEKKEDVPPNGGYGWVCVACIATINA